MRTILYAAGAVLGLLVAAGAARADTITTIAFAEGTNGQNVGSGYEALGVRMPNLRFHDGTVSGNVPFPFADSLGAVKDGGISPDYGKLVFASAVDFVEVDAFGQAAFDLLGLEPYSWTLDAYNASGSLVASATEYWGYDQTSAGYYPIGNLSLRVEALGAITELRITSDRKLGFDTIRFTEIDGFSSGGTAPVPEPGTLALFGLGAAGLAWRRRNLKP